MKDRTFRISLFLFYFSLPLVLSLPSFPLRFARDPIMLDLNFQTMLYSSCRWIFLMVWKRHLLYEAPTYSPVFGSYPSMASRIRKRGTTRGLPKM